MARRIARVVSTLVVAAGLLFGALLVLPAALGLAALRDRQRLDDRHLRPRLARARRGRPGRASCARATSSPTARRRGSGPAGLVTHRIAEITTDQRRPAHVPHQGRRQRAADPWTFHLAQGRAGAREARACPTSGSRWRRSASRDLRMLIVGLPAGADRPLQPRRPLAGGRRRAPRRCPGEARSPSSPSCSPPPPSRAASAVPRPPSWPAPTSRHDVRRLRRLQRRHGLAERPRHAAALHRRRCRRPPPRTARSSRSPSQRSPAGAGTWTTICAPDRGALHLLLGQHGRRRRPLRPARRRARRLGLHEDEHGRARAGSTTPPPPPRSPPRRRSPAPRPSAPPPPTAAAA